MKENNMDARGVLKGLFAGRPCSCPLLGHRHHRQAKSTDPGAAALQSTYSQPSLPYSTRQGSQTLPMSVGLAPAPGGKKCSQNVPKG